MVVDNLTADEVILFYFIFFFPGVLCLVKSFVFFSFLWFDFFSFQVLCDFQMSLNLWFGCEEHAKCAWA